MNASVTTKNGRHILRMERQFAHGPDKVWRAITEPAELSAWWPLKIDDLPLKQGAALHFYDDEGNTEDGTITALQVGKVLAFAGKNGEHEVRFELTTHERGCLLIFTHAFPADQPPAQHATGWHLCFEALEAKLDGKPIPALGYNPDIRRHYDEVLSTTRDAYQPGSAGDATAHRDGDRWTLVMVREFRHAPAKVWDALTDPAQLREWAPFDVERNLETTGPIILTMVGGSSADVMDGNVTRAVRPRVLEYTWGPDVLRWELEPTDAGTRLTLHHTVGDRTWLPKVAAGWHICLDVMARAVAGQPIGRIVAGEAKQFGWDRLNAEYAKSFGVENTGWPEHVATT
jgi:uncharacterized protein YndB with AHSA1/START domain